MVPITRAVWFLVCFAFPMGLSDDLIATGNKLLLSNYGRAPIVLARGAGQPAVGRRGPPLPGHDRRASRSACWATATPAWPRRCTRRPAGCTTCRTSTSSRRRSAWPRRCRAAGFPDVSSSATRAPRPTRRRIKIARRYQIVVRGQPERTEIVADGGQLPRPHPGRAVGHRAAQVPAELRPAGARDASSSRSATSRRPARPSTTRPAR